MPNRCPRHIVIAALAGSLFATVALADSKGSGPGNGAAYAECVRLAVQNYNMALELCPPPGTYGRAYCENMANGALATAMGRCGQGTTAALRGNGSFATGSSSMHGTYGGENGGNGSSGNSARGGYTGSNGTRDIRGNDQPGSSPFGSRHFGSRHPGQIPPGAPNGP